MRYDFFVISRIWLEEKYHLNFLLYFLIESINVRRFCSCSSWCTFNALKIDRVIFHLVFLFFRFWILLIIEATLTRVRISHCNILYWKYLLIFINLTWRRAEFVMVCFHMISFIKLLNNNTFLILVNRIFSNKINKYHNSEEKFLVLYFIHF